jgi:excisionase family DNA binding protein
MPTITTEEAAARLNTTPEHVTRLIRSGSLAAERQGERAWCVDAASVTRYKQRRKRPGRPRGAVSPEPAKSKKYGDGTPAAEHVRAYNREYRRRRREQGLS